MSRKALMVVIAVVFFFGIEVGRTYPPHHYVKYYGGRLLDTNTGNVINARIAKPSKPLSALIKAWYVKTFHGNDVWVNGHGWVGKDSALARCYYPKDVFDIVKCQRHPPKGWVKGFVPDTWASIDPCDFGKPWQHYAPGCSKHYLSADPDAGQAVTAKH